MSAAVLTPRPPLHRPQIEVIRDLCGDGEGEGNGRRETSMRHVRHAIESPPLYIAAGTYCDHGPAGDGEGPGVRT